MPSEHPRRRLQDIVDNIDSILLYTRGLDQNAFIENNLIIDAVERCLSRISEAARKLGDHAELLVPTQPWEKIRGLGNLLRHDYDLIRLDDLWAIVTDDLASLRVDCVAAIDQLKSAS